MIRERVRTRGHALDAAKEIELWEEHPGEEGVCEVLHVSEPELAEIKAG